MAVQSNLSELVIRLKDEVSANSGKIQKSLGSLKNKITAFASALGVGLGAGAVVAFAKSVIDLAGHLQDLSEQTGISAQTLSGIKSVLEESGTSVDAFAKGIFIAQKNIGQASQETKDAIKALSLDFNQLRSASPEKFLDLIAGALGKIEDPIKRNALGARLLGKSFQELGPALSQIAGRLDELRKQGISAADIKRLDEFDDSVTRLKNELQKLTVGPLTAFVSLLQLLTGSSGPILSSAEQLEVLSERLKELQGPLGRLRDPFGPTKEDVQREIAILARIFEAEKKAKAKTVPLIDPEELKKQQAAFEQLQKQIVGMSEKAMDPTEKLRSDQAQLEEAIKKANLSLAKQRELFELLRTAVESNFAKMDADKWEKHYEKQREIARNFQEEFGQSTQQKREKAKEVEQNVSLDLMKESDRRREIIRREMEEQIRVIQAAAIVDEDIARRSTEIIAGIRAAVAEKAKKESDELTKFQERAFERMQDAMGDALKDGLQGQIKSWQELGTRVKSLLDSIAAEYLAMQLKIGLFGKEYGAKQAGGEMGGLFGWIGRLLGMGGGGGSATYVNPQGLLEYHKGGVAGMTSAPIRFVTAADFAGARRYHGGGLAGDEVPAILQRGEGVVSRSDMERGGRQTIIFNIQATDAGSFMRSRSQIESMIARAARRGQRKL